MAAAILTTSAILNRWQSFQHHQPVRTAEDADTASRAGESRWGGGTRAREGRKDLGLGGQASGAQTDLTCAIMLSLVTLPSILIDRSKDCSVPRVKRPGGCS